VLGRSTPLSWSSLADDYDRIRDLIEKTIPGFENFNARVRRPGGFHLYNAARERKFDTASGKAQFSINELPDDSLADGRYRMMTLRSHDQYNTTIYGNDDRYRGIEGGRRIVLMNEADMRAAGIAPQTRVDLHSDFGGQRRSAYRFLAVPYPIPARCVATYFPEANVLVPLNHFARGSFTPVSKNVIVTIEPSGLD
jgi:anaerobic selenocysteine-containing dehydrogenase